MPPAKKVLKRKADPALNPINDRVPTKGKAQIGHKHSDGKGCWTVDYFDGSSNPKGMKRYQHWPDEGGAIMSAMRHTRDLGVPATIYGPDGQVVAQFRARTYDVKAYSHSLVKYNEDLQAQIATAARTRSKSTATKAVAKKQPAKKSLKKKVKG